MPASTSTTSPPRSSSARGCAEPAGRAAPDLPVHRCRVDVRPSRSRCTSSAPTSTSSPRGLDALVGTRRPGHRPSEPTVKIYEKDGATWLKTTDYGDDKGPRRVRRQGWRPPILPATSPTISDKRGRGSTCASTCWVTTTVIARLKAAAAGLGYDPDSVGGAHRSDGQPGPRRATRPDEQRAAPSSRSTTWSMPSESTRPGTPDPVVGGHADRHRPGTVVLRVSENPVYYVQYAHARLSALSATRPSWA